MDASPSQKPYSGSISKIHCFLDICSHHHFFHFMPKISHFVFLRLLDPYDFYSCFVSESFCASATTTSSDSGSEIFSNSQYFESSITFALLITIVFLQFHVSCHFFSLVSYTVFSVGQLAMSFVASLLIVIIYFE